jgi:predicted O-methyltransferase YrrM
MSLFPIRPAAAGHISKTGGADEPWLTRDFINIFSSWDTKEWTMFEWGTGASTYWFSQRVKFLVSMDNNPSWFNLTKGILEKALITNVDFHLQPLNIVAYYDTILKYSPFDCILIDGRNRVVCSEYAVKNIKPDGIIILDNSERPRYKEIFETLKGFEHYSTSNGMWSTDYWRANGV